jgi:pyruvate/2-oxoglutarate dehydrogenase complex dihydrolipoamide acyltransferase (E2) component
MTDWGAATPLKMPALSPTMTTGTVSKWLVAEGDTVDAGDAIAEIDTDKASVDYEMQDDGILAKILVAEGTEDVPVGQVLALLVDEEGDLAEVQSKDWSAVLSKAATGAAAASQPGDSGSAAATASPSGSGANFGTKRVSPAAAHLVRSEQIDVSGLQGTGRHGMITKGDLLVHLGRAPASSLPSPASHESASPAAAAVAEPAATPSASASAPVFSLGDVIDLGGNLPAVEFGDGTRPASAPVGQYEDGKPSMVRKVISSRLTESKATIPHSYSVMDCRLDAMLELRKQLKAAGVIVSVNDLVIKAVAKSLQAVPEANCRFDEASNSIQANDSVDISVAVATDGGLITPIVTDADSRGLAGINAAVKDLAGRARDNRLAPHEYQGGSFTVSNLGMFGIDEFSAVINPPQACILAVGRGAQRAVFANDAAAVATDVDSITNVDETEPELATVMSVMMSSDRRVVDDVIAAQFLASFRKHCETPALLMA